MEYFEDEDQKVESKKFDKTFLIYIDRRLLDDVKEVVGNKGYIYSSTSHFIRSAIIEKMRRERS